MFNLRKKMIQPGLQAGNLNALIFSHSIDSSSLAKEGSP